MTPSGPTLGPNASPERTSAIEVAARALVVAWGTCRGVVRHDATLVIGAPCDGLRTHFTDLIDLEMVLGHTNVTVATDSNDLFVEVCDICAEIVRGLGVEPLVPSLGPEIRALAAALNLAPQETVTP